MLVWNAGTALCPCGHGMLIRLRHALSGTANLACVATKATATTMIIAAAPANACESRVPPKSNVLDHNLRPFVPERFQVH
eukprot:2573899-Rhodomonas_salina.3